MTAQDLKSETSPAVTDRRYRLCIRMTVPRPEPRGYAVNLVLLFGERAKSIRTASTDLRSTDQPRPGSFRELDAAADASRLGLVRAGRWLGARMGMLPVT